MKDSGMKMKAVVERFPYVANRYCRRLAAKSPAFAMQAMPDVRELESGGFESDDPFGELDGDVAATSCPGVVQRFEDRVLVMASDSCFMNCRHCTRKHFLKNADVIRTDEELESALEYVRTHPLVRDVLISGGDPLVLPDDEVMRFIDSFASLEQVDVVRLCTRAPCTNPIRFSKQFVSRLGESRKVWVNTQFNHPDELTDEALAACARLVDAGIPVSCQTVLLAGVNDDGDTLLELFRALQRARVRPYYVFQCDPIPGIAHFRVPLERAQELASYCAERIGGLALPRFVADIPGERRKMPIELL